MRKSRSGLNINIGELECIASTHLHRLESTSIAGPHSPFNAQHNVVVSCDVTGFVEYWTPEEPFHAHHQQDTRIFELKSTTDLFDFKKTKTVPTTLTFSKDGEKFAIFSIVDRQIRVFDFRSAKITRRYDESLEALQAIQSLPAPDAASSQSTTRTRTVAIHRSHRRL